MGSRPAIEAFMWAAPKAGIECILASSTAQFTFANGETSKVSQCCRVKFPTAPPTWTDFDIVEQGAVPILMSLGQMKNLGFDLEMTPETVYLTCKAFGCYRQPLHVAYTGHLVLDLARLKYSPSDSRPRAGGQHSVFAGKSDSDCPACRGLHRKHTCSRGTGTSARPTRSGDPDSELPSSGDSQGEPIQQQTTGVKPVGERERPQGPHPAQHHPPLLRVRGRRRIHLRLVLTRSHPPRWNHRMETQRAFQSPSDGFTRSSRTSPSSSNCT